MTTIKRLREVFGYDASTGVLTWIARPGPFSRCLPGEVAGTPTKAGYLVVQLDGKQLKVHRVAWALSHGKWPAHLIDHRDTIRSHNWLSNLREAGWYTNSQNQQRPHKRNKTGFLGVHHAKAGRFGADIGSGGKVHHIGTFDTAEEAHAAYVATKRKVHPGGLL